jgi:hypothetical protein
MKSFTQFVGDLTPKDVVFVFERFNPPTIAHEKLLEQVAEIASGSAYRIYSSHFEDAKKNPLKLEEKVKWMRKVFPKYARNVMSDDVNTVFSICSKLYEQGFTHATMMTESSRVLEFEALLNGHNGVKTNDGFYNFKEGVKVVGCENSSLQLSESAMHTAAKSNDLESFAKNLPSSFQAHEELFNAVRNGLGLKESRNFRKHLQLESVGDRREAYVSGDLFEVGNEVVIKESEELGKITHCGSNYLIVELNDGKKVRKWLSAVELLEKKEITLESQLLPITLTSSPEIAVRTPSVQGTPISLIRKNRIA